MKRIKMFFMTILCLVCITLITTNLVSGDDNKTTRTNITINQDDHESDWIIWASEDDKIEVSVTVTSPSNGKVDVYILTQTQSYNYPEGSFTPAYVSENKNLHSFTFTVPDDQIYYLIIDNEDNSRATDAVPTGSVTVDYEYDNPLAEKVEEALLTGIWICIAGIIIIVVIIIVIIVVVVMVLSKKEKPPQQPQYPPQQPPYQQYPQQQYPQQPYQPPPQQPPQQPPPGQPPGQTPGT